MRLYLVRHGRTKWNKEQRIQGSIDEPLDEEGRTQANRLGERLQHIDFSMIYSSPMRRAHETALILNRYLQKEVALEPALREATYGAAEGLTRTEYHQLYAEGIAAALSLERRERFQYRIVPDGECPADVCRRTIPFLTRLADRWSGQNLLIVCHGEVIRSALVFLFELNEAQAAAESAGYSIDNTGYAVLEFDGSVFTMKESQGVSRTRHDYSFNK